MQNVGTLTNRGPYRRAHMKQYLATMSKPDETHLWNDMVAHILKEQGFEIREDPRSIYDPEQLWESLARYSPENDTYVDQHDPAIKEGINLAWSIFAKPRYIPLLKPLKEMYQVQAAIKGEKYAGLPSMGKKRDDIYAYDREQQIRLGLKSPSPCLAGKRTQRGNKTRLVWMYPHEMTIMEARFARPLIDTFLKRRTTMAFGMRKCVLGAIVDSISFHTGGTPVGMDYSKFDSSIPSYLIRQAFKMLATWFSPKDRERFSYDTIIKYFLHTPIVMPDGNLYTGKKHGVPSGSYFTQIIDSIVNTILIGAMSYELKLGIQWERMLVLGDDVIFAVDNPQLEDMKTFLIRFGITVNVEKTRFDSHFLGAVWKFGKPTRDINELVAMATQPESFKKMGKTYSERRRSALSLLNNYQTCYVNAWKLLDKVLWSPREAAFWDIRISPELMSGSDKFLAEYSADIYSRAESRPTTVKRFLC